MSIQNSPQSIIIIADDVTGAADSAARCRHAGLSSVIDLSMQPATTTHTDASRLPAHDPAHDPALASVLALSTDSRFLSAQQAAAQVSTMIAPLATIMQTGRVRWYKKIDSTLRGNIGSEIEAMLPLVTPPGAAPCALICPAFPAQQRTLVDGYLCYAGLPPRSVHLPTMLAEQCALPVATIDLATIRAGGNTLRQALQAAYQAQPGLLVADAETEEDLHQLLLVGAEIMPHALLCGSAGLVGVLAQQVAGSMPAALREAAVATPEVQHPVLGVMGSGSQMARQQIDYLRANSTVTLIEIDPAQVMDTPVELSTLRQLVHQAGADVVLHLPPPESGTVLEGKLARQYATTLATVAQTFIKAMQPATLLLVGGDTAVHTLAVLGIQQLTVLTELLPGMPLTVGEGRQGENRQRDGRQGDTYQIILKAGNHGDQTTLAHLLK